MESLLVFRSTAALNAVGMSYSGHSIVLGLAVTTVAGLKSGLKKGMFLKCPALFKQVCSIMEYAIEELKKPSHTFLTLSKYTKRCTEHRVSHLLIMKMEAVIFHTEVCYTLYRSSLNLYWLVKSATEQLLKIRFSIFHIYYATPWDYLEKKMSCFGKIIWDGISFSHLLLSCSLVTLMWKSMTFLPRYSKLVFTYIDKQ